MKTRSRVRSRLIWRMAWRLLRSHKGPYLSAVTLISLGGVVLGVAALLVIFSITSGFEEVFREKLLGVYPHAIAIGGGADVADYRGAERRLRKVEGVTHASAATYDEMMISHRGRRAGVLIKGIQRDDSPACVQLRDRTTVGDLDELGRTLEVVRTGSEVHATRSVGGVDWTAIAWSDGSLQVLPPCVEEAQEKDALVRIQLPPGETGGITLDDGLESQVMTISDDEHGRSPYLRVFDGALTIRFDGFEHMVLTEAGGIYTVVIHGAARRTRLTDTPPRRAETPATLHLVNATGDTLNLASGDHEVPVPPGEDVRIAVAERRLPGVVLGVGLAGTLRVGLGDEVNLVSPLQGMSRFFRSTPGARPIADAFEVVGILDLGFYEYDSRLAIIDFDQALRFLHRGDRARWVEIITEDILDLDDTLDRVEAALARFRLDDLHRAASAMADRTTRIRQSLTPAEDLRGGVARLAWLQDLIETVRYGPSEMMTLGIQQDHRIVTWREMNRAMFTAMQRQRLVLSLFFLIIIIVAASNIVGSQTMMVREKLREISLLKVLGFTHRDVRNLFTIHGIAIGGGGALLGLVVGAAIGLALDRIGFPLDPVVYYVSRLPVALRWGDMLFVTGAAVVLVFAAVLIAASRAARRTPVEGLTELE
ncbi:MAG: FtsX-like permease family protein [Pseudomonadota bacterium]